MKSDLINLIFINSYLAPQAKNLRKRPSDTSHIDHHKLYLQDRKNDVGIHLSKYIPVHYDPYSSTFQYRILNFPVQNFSSTEKGTFPVHFPVHFPLKYIQVHSSTFKYGWPPCHALVRDLLDTPDKTYSSLSDLFDETTIEDIHVLHNALNKLYEEAEQHSE